MYDIRLLFLFELKNYISLVYYQSSIGNTLDNIPQFYDVNESEPFTKIVKL